MTVDHSFLLSSIYNTIRFYFLVFMTVDHSFLVFITPFIYYTFQVDLASKIIFSLSDMQL